VGEPEMSPRERQVARVELEIAREELTRRHRAECERSGHMYEEGDGPCLRCGEQQGHPIEFLMYDEEPPLPF
jgi:hypothetical protein